MALFGSPRPTFSYPRIVYPSGYGVGGYGEGEYGAAILDFDDPAFVSRPILDQVRDESVSPSSRRKVLFERTGEFRQIITPLMDENKAHETEDFFRRWGGQGGQFQFYCDRFTGAFLEFEGTLEDQHGTLGMLTGQGSYEPATFGQGLRLGSGGFVDFPTAPAAQQASLDAAEGIFGLVVAPSFAGDDNLNHGFLDIDPAGNGYLQLIKTSTNGLRLEVADASLNVRSVLITGVSWAPNSVQKIVGKWKDASSLELWLNGVKGPAASGSGTGILPALPMNLRIGTTGSEANGLYDRVFFLTRAFDLNAQVVAALTDSHFPRAKNYYDKAEVVETRLVFERPHPARALYRTTLTLREGVA